MWKHKKLNHIGKSDKLSVQFRFHWEFLQSLLLSQKVAKEPQKTLKIQHNSLTYTHTPFNGHLSGTTRVSRYQKGRTNLDFTEARDSEWQWHQLGHMQVCTSLQTYNQASTPPLSFLQAGYPSCRPTNSVKALKACKPIYIQLNYNRFTILCKKRTTQATAIGSHEDYVPPLNKTLQKREFDITYDFHVDVVACGFLCIRSLYPGTSQSTTAQLGRQPTHTYCPSDPSTVRKKLQDILQDI